MSGSSDRMRADGRGSEKGPAPVAEGAEPSWEATVRKDILVGQQVGEYVVRRRIGSGGMGVVYEGEHPVIGRKVAIKLLRPDSNAGLLSRDLASEARATSAIRHRGIIDIFGFGTLPGVGQYLVMEYLNGQPLDDVLQERAPLSLAEALQLITEVLAALSAAHGAGVIHRDLKPGNIFVVQESNGTEYVKVLDFGLAKQTASPNAATPQTRASLIVGTPEYMAPEQAYGQAVSPRTDLYAVGIILFEMLTGRLPFQGDSPMHVAMQQVQAQPPTPSSLVQSLPPELDELILRLLAKDPEQRPASAEAVLRELKVLSRTLAAEMTRLTGMTRTAPARTSSPSQPSLPVSGASTSRELEPTVLRPRTAAPPSLGTLPTQAFTPAEQALAPRSGSRMKQGVAAGVVLLLLGGGAALMLRGSADPGLAPPSGVAPAPVAPKPDVAPVAAPAPSAPVAAQAPAREVAGVPAPVAELPRQGVEAEAQRPAAPAMGTFQLEARCFTVVYIDGVLRARGAVKLSLSAGPHRLELRGNAHVQDFTKTILIRAGKELEFVAPCQPIK